jgi:hypothetical protein
VIGGIPRNFYELKGYMVKSVFVSRRLTTMDAPSKVEGYIPDDIDCPEESDEEGYKYRRNNRQGKEQVEVIRKRLPSRPKLLT